MKVTLARTTLVNELDKSNIVWRDNIRRTWTHEKNSGDAVRRLSTIIQGIFCAQSGASFRLTVCKWSGESRYPGAFPPVLEKTFVAPFLPTRLTSPGSPKMTRPPNFGSKERSMGPRRDTEKEDCDGCPPTYRINKVLHTIRFSTMTLCQVV